MRRNSPSVTTCRPQSCCSLTTSRMHSSWIFLNKPSSISPEARLRKASRRLFGRNRLPMWSARYGGITLLSLEPGLAFLVEGAHAFLAVLGADQLVVGLDLEAVAGGEVHLQPIVDRFLCLAYGERRIRRDLFRSAQGLLEHVVAHPVHDAPLVALLCVERLRAQDQLLGAALAGGS